MCIYVLNWLSYTCKRDLYSWERALLHSCYYTYTAAHCNILQHTATRCNTLQHTATHRFVPDDCKLQIKEQSLLHSKASNVKIFDVTLEQVDICVSVCCSVLQCVAIKETGFHTKASNVKLFDITLEQVDMCVAVCCSVSQCVAVCCNQRKGFSYESLKCKTLRCHARVGGHVCCSVLQCVAVCCSVLQYVAVYWSALYSVKKASIAKPWMWDILMSRSSR